MIDKYSNPFTSLLGLLNIKYTKHYSEKIYAEHPNRNNLLGLSQMLREYNIANEGIEVDDKKTFDLFSVKLPFIAQMGTGFAVVSKITGNKISCIINDLEIIIDRDTFIKSWKGVLLLVEPNEDSIEPDFNAHQKDLFIQNVKKGLLVGAFVGAFIISLIANKQFWNIGLVLLLLVNLCGVYISFLLLQKQLNVKSRIAEKLCSVFSKGDCNDILNTNAAQLFGLISWSEIGAGYFIGNLIIISFAPFLIPYVAAINLLILPYSFWSVWYQKFKAKQWCILCLIVQLILWLILTINIVFGHFMIHGYTLEQIIATGLIYIIPTLSMNALMAITAQSRKAEILQYGFNSLKFTEEVLVTQLTEQSHFKIEKEDSKIIFGNPIAKIRITIYSNPHCNPCARMHRKVEKLLKEHRDKICVQYIFCSFGPEWEDSSKHLVALYLNNDVEKAESIYNEWFESGKTNRSEFFDKYNMDIDAPYVLEEYERHQEWGKLNKIEATPTVFVNGYLLPSLYDLEDLAYFVNSDEVK